MTLDVAGRTAYTEDHEAFRDSVRSFIKAEVVPNIDRWDEAGIVEKAIWPKAGAVGVDWGVEHCRTLSPLKRDYPHRATLFQPAIPL